ncbi:MAG: putative transporter [Paludibacteraceae bacterium]|nr:putative transporter [Paludibacteraceae bacterium]
MDFIVNLFTGYGIGSVLVYLCITAFVGVAIGRINIGGIKVGIAGVLFTGLLLAHIKGVGAGNEADLTKYDTILSFVKEFGLILFVYSIGIEVGPRFFTAFKDEGLKLNALACSIILIGLGIAFGIKMFIGNGISSSEITGIMCGAVTNTPGLGAAQQALTDVSHNAADPAMRAAAADAVNKGTAGMAYAVAYPFGVLGLIAAILLIRFIFRVKIDEEVDKYNKEMGAAYSNKLESVEITVTNQNLFGSKVSFVKKFVDKELAISRVLRKDTFFVPNDDDELQSGDVIYGVSSSNHIEKLKAQIGTVEIGDKREVSGDLAMCDVLVTNRKIAGKTINQIGINRRYEANITRLFREGREILPTPTTTLELGDTVRIVGKKALLKEVRNEIGNSVKELAKPNTIPIFIGIFLGVLLGSIPIAIPGMPVPAKLGLAGGPLIVAICLGYKGRIGKLDFYMTSGANFMLRELGIILFLACVGLSSGAHFAETVANGGYVWMIYGAAITFIPVMLVAIVGMLMNVNYLKISGILAGSMTDPPVLDYANSLAPVQAQSTAYATVYPLSMFLRILVAQILVLTTL